MNKENSMNTEKPETEVKSEVPNQHLADRQAGLVNEKGEKIDPNATDETSSAEETENPIDETLNAGNLASTNNTTSEEQVVEGATKADEKPVVADIDKSNATPAGPGTPEEQIGEQPNGEKVDPAIDAAAAEEAAKIAANAEAEKKNVENIHAEEGEKAGQENAGESTSEKVE